MNRKILMRLLVECERSLGWFASGVTVVEADDGRTAVEALRTEMAIRGGDGGGAGFDLILMDYIMLQMHGPDAALVMRKELHYQGVIIGLGLPYKHSLSSHVPICKCDLARYIALGADTVLTKPLTKAKLADTLLHFNV
mmetsp:Transcript_17533/g.24082  ORF Transcript_17533/g.24082 Transcript_17533/m.24082 type:complete len:139 (+) Transcript_17533:523-939(+)